MSDRDQGNTAASDSIRTQNDSGLNLINNSPDVSSPSVYSSDKALVASLIGEVGCQNLSGYWSTLSPSPKSENLVTTLSGGFFARATTFPTSVVRREKTRSPNILLGERQ